MVAGARSKSVAWLRRVLHPRAWPVRWRIAAVSSGLTLAILMVFGGVIGQIATSRIRDDFNSEVHNAVEILHEELRVVQPVVGGPYALPHELGPYVLTDDAKLRVFDTEGKEVGHSKTPRGLGEPVRGIVEEDG